MPKPIFEEFRDLDLPGQDLEDLQKEMRNLLWNIYAGDKLEPAFVTDWHR
jgi:hypothetical protein